MDRRSKRKKLESMANQTVSPNEAEIAREKLKDMPPDPEPPAFPMLFINGIPVGHTNIRNLNIVIKGNGSVMSVSWEEV